MEHNLNKINELIINSINDSNINDSNEKNVVVHANENKKIIKKKKNF